MKKIIALLTLLLAFSINANAQEKAGYIGLNSTEKAAKQAAELSEFLGLEDTMKENFAKLFEQKFQILENKEITEERKKELSRVIEAKISGTLDSDQMERLKKNPELLNKLIN
jgi:hypothetical protein